MFEKIKQSLSYISFCSTSVTQVWPWMECNVMGHTWVTEDAFCYVSECNNKCWIIYSLTWMRPWCEQYFLAYIVLDRGFHDFHQCWQANRTTHIRAALWSRQKPDNWCHFMFRRTSTGNAENSRRWHLLLWKVKEILTNAIFFPVKSVLLKNLY